MQLFTDPNEKVRSEASSCFSGCQKAELGEYVGLISEFVQSPAFASAPAPLIRALETTTASLPEVVCEVCERFLDIFGSGAADLRTHTALEARSLSQLAVRVCTHSADPSLEKRALDLIDRMAQMDVYGLKDALSAQDR